MDTSIPPIVPIMSLNKIIISLFVSSSFVHDSHIKIIYLTHMADGLLSDYDKKNISLDFHNFSLSFSKIHFPSYFCKFNHLLG